MVGFEGEKGGVGGEHVVPRKCATASQSYSFTGSSASSEESSPAISLSLFECVKASLTSSLQSIQIQRTRTQSNIIDSLPYVIASALPLYELLLFKECSHVIRLPTEA